MKYKKQLAVLLFLALFMGQAMAVEYPSPYKIDAHNVWVTYKKNDVIWLKMPINDAVTVLFSPSEIIRAGNIKVGASKVLNIQRPSGTSNTLTFTVKSYVTPANMTVITNNRIYTFVIQGDPKAKPIYTLHIKYPKHKKAHKESERNMGDPVPTGRKLNQNYWYAGDKALQPLTVWDDGVFTYITFGVHTPIPAVYKVIDSSGDEQIMTTVMANDNTMKVEGIAKQFTLRDGKLWLSILNKGYHYDAR